MIDPNTRIKAFTVVFVVVVLQLHLLRNISKIYYLLYLASFLLAVWFSFVRWRSLQIVEKKLSLFVIVIFLFPIFPLVLGILQGRYDSLEDVLSGLSRLIFSLPLFLVVLTSPSDRKTFELLFLISSLITFVAALSIPYQFVFEPISWFAESSERSGVGRFASLFGSLTALGGVVGFGILAASLINSSKFFRAFLISGMVLGALLSLQKAAIANTILAFMFLPFIGRFEKKNVLASMTYFALFFVFAGSFFWTEIGLFLESIRISSDSEFTGDFSFSESIVQRLMELPSIAIDFHGPWSLFFGVGPAGGSGAFGYVDIPMSHNGFIDLFLVGGIFYFLLFTSFIFFLFVKPKNDGIKFIPDLRKFGLFCLLILLLNMLFSGLNFFTPSGAMFYAIAIKCVLQSRLKQA